MWIEVLFLQHHRVFVTIEEFHTLRLIGTSQTETIGDTRLASHTTFGLDLDDTISALRTPDGCCGGIFQDTDVLNILRVNVQQFSKLFIVGRCEIEIFGITRFPDITVNNDKRLLVSINT